MSDFSYQQMYGQNIELDEDPHSDFFLKISKTSFYDETFGGDLPVGIGRTPYLNTGTPPAPVQLLYGIIMLTRQNQGASINSIPGQKLWIADAGRSFAVGDRQGQIKRSFTLNFFIDTGVLAVPGLDNFENNIFTPPDITPGQD